MRAYCWRLFLFVMILGRGASFSTDEMIVPPFGLEKDNYVGLSPSLKKELFQSPTNLKEESLRIENALHRRKSSFFLYLLLSFVAFLLYIFREKVQRFIREFLKKKPPKKDPETTLRLEMIGIKNSSLSLAQKTIGLGRAFSHYLRRGVPFRFSNKKYRRDDQRFRHLSKGVTTKFDSILPFLGGGGVCKPLPQEPRAPTAFFKDRKIFKTLK